MGFLGDRESFAEMMEIGVGVGFQPALLADKTVFKMIVFGGRQSWPLN
jgi:hypothetical protein